MIKNISEFFLKITGLKSKKATAENSVTIVKKDVVSDKDEAETLWKIYNDSFERINKQSPCRQSFNREHFLEILTEPSVKKYIAINKNSQVVGLGLLTNNLKNSPWVSEEYFKDKYPNHYAKGLVYYFLGIAVHEEHRKKGYSLAMLNRIHEDIPSGAIMSFDHSHNINPFLHHFTRIVKKTKSIRRKYLDRQHYHIVYFD